MSVQTRLNNDNRPLILFGTGFKETDAVLLQDAGRGTTALVFGTLMAKVAATQKWVPFTDETAVDGTAIPLGVMVSSDVTGAALVAGDVTDVSILVGGAITIDSSLLIIENSKTLATLIKCVAASPIQILTVKDYLHLAGIYPEASVAISASENA